LQGRTAAAWNKCAARSKTGTLIQTGQSSHEVPAQIGLSELTGGAHALLNIHDTHGWSE